MKIDPIPISEPPGISPMATAAGRAAPGFFPLGYSDSLHRSGLSETGYS